MARKRNADAGPSPAEQRKAILKAIEETYTDGDTVHILFRKAVELDTRKRALFTETAANRRSLRDLATQGIANKQDVDAVYPPKKDSDEATEAEAA